MVRDIIDEGTIKELIGEPKQIKKINEVLGDIELTYEEERTLIWLSGLDNATIEPMLSIFKKCKNIK